MGMPHLKIRIGISEGPNIKSKDSASKSDHKTWQKSPIYQPPKKTWYKIQQPLASVCVPMKIQGYYKW